MTAKPFLCIEATVWRHKPFKNEQNQRIILFSASCLVQRRNPPPKLNYQPLRSSRTTGSACYAAVFNKPPEVEQAA